MEHERKELLAQKRAQLKIKQKRAEIQQYKDRLTKSIEHFSQKYRYADEAEALKIETFISKLNFEQPGQLAIQEVCPYPHGNAYLCFLMGTDALFEIYVFGKYSDIMSDHDAWEVFSPYLLLLDEDFIHYTSRTAASCFWQRMYAPIRLRVRIGSSALGSMSASLTLRALRICSSTRWA